MTPERIAELRMFFNGAYGEGNTALHECMKALPELLDAAERMADVQSSYCPDHWSEALDTGHCALCRIERERDEAIKRAEAAERERDRHIAGTGELREEIQSVKAELGLMGGGIGLTLAQEIANVVRGRDSALARAEAAEAKLPRLLAFVEAYDEWQVKCDMSEEHPKEWADAAFRVMAAREALEAHVDDELDPAPPMDDEVREWLKRLDFTDLDGDE